MEKRRKIFVTIDGELFGRLEKFRAEFSLNRSQAAAMAMAIGMRLLDTIFQGMVDASLRREIAQLPEVQKRIAEVAGDALEEMERIAGDSI